MAEAKNSPTDPFAAWRDWMSQSETRVNGLLNEVMATEGFGRVMGVVTKAMVSMQKSMGEGMERYFSALSLPTHSDVVDIAKRLSTIESRLHTIETRIGRLAGADTNESENVVQMPRPPRTRKPANGKGGAP